MDLTNEILNDKEKYPDEAEITLGDGRKVTIKEFRDQLQPRAAFTEASTKWKQRESELQNAVDGLNAQLLEASQTRQVEPTRVAAQPGTISQEDLLADPILGPLVRQQLEAVARLEAHEERLKQHEHYVMEREYRGSLSQVGARYNARFNADGKGKAFDSKGFLDYMIGHKYTDMEEAYKAWGRDDEIAATAKESEARGVEKGRAAARVPNVPFGRRRTPVKPEGLPATFQELDDEAYLNDPEMQAAAEEKPG